MATKKAIFEGLKSRFDVIANGINRSTDIVYVDYPLHPNIGDLLINLGTEKFFENYNFSVTHRYSYHDFPSKRLAIDDKSVFAFHGGGNFGDLYPEHLNLLLQIIVQYPKNQIVVFPQTVFFKNPENQKKICAQLKQHSNITIYVRDYRSLESLTKSGLDNVTVMPDMAHLLFGTLSPNPIAGSEEPTYFMRRDEEVGNIPDISRPESAQTIDWEDGISSSQRIKFAALIRATRLAKAIGYQMDTCKPWYKLRDDLVADGIKLISRSNLIYTNRLHAMLLALLVGRDVVGFDNSYGKLTGYYETWLSDVEGLKMIYT